MINKIEITETETERFFGTKNGKPVMFEGSLYQGYDENEYCSFSQIDSSGNMYFSTPMIDYSGGGLTIIEVFDDEDAGDDKNTWYKVGSTGKSLTKIERPENVEAYITAEVLKRNKRKKKV